MGYAQALVDIKKGDVKKEEKETEEEEVWKVKSTEKKDIPFETRNNEQLIADKVCVIEQTINVVEKMCLMTLILLFVAGLKIFLL